MHIYYTMRAVCDWFFVIVLSIKNTLEKVKKGEFVAEKGLFPHCF